MMQNKQNEVFIQVNNLTQVEKNIRKERKRVMGLW